MEIRFIDSICGSGKTQGIIKEINKNYMEENYIYVTPFLSESERIQNSCKEAMFVLPERINGSKTNGLFDLVDDEQNVSMSHQLLKGLSLEQVDRFRNYTLILDEVIDLISVYSDLKLKDLELMLANNLLVIGKNNMLVMTPEGESKLFKLSTHTQMAKLIKEHKLFVYGGKTVICELPIEIITSFKNVTIMSYLIEGSYLYQMLKSHGCKINKMMIGDDNDIIDYNSEIANYRAKKAFELINIYDGSKSIIDLNLKLAKYCPSLSYSQQLKWSNADKKEVGKVIRQYFRSLEATSESCLYSNFGTQLPIKSYVRSFLSYNARATNEYSDTSNLAYIIDKNNNPALRGYVSNKYDITVNEDKLSLDSMIQWIFRSRIRNGQPVNLFLPSLKMRKLLMRWGNGFIG